ncbi:hypothetical protein VLK81_09590 [Citroniella saccharovorans]|uniref:Uncharacterized protein n=1 Tax=Citroniella saccharovorans TaxID=2053367 RepID=A0AAW9MWH3_9FIRM|nr:hypothetical protein [Citroniella saccharovorans]MEB3428878.1 hypothetical protein [Citroniella saccharovorans]MEB3428925.1 hypothetical protein [Citroniella saccharovorans]MEB3430235.1 hypothetical protein [Citroniella saccharovorans]
MKIDYVDVLPKIDIERGGVYIGGTIQFQSNRPPYDFMRCEINLNAEEMTAVMTKKVDKFKMAEDKLKDLIELDLVKVDSFDMERFNRELEAKNKEIESLQGQVLELTLLLSNTGGENGSTN